MGAEQAEHLHIIIPNNKHLGFTLFHCKILKYKCTQLKKKKKCQLNVNNDLDTQLLKRETKGAVNQPKQFLSGKGLQLRFSRVE